MIWPFTIVERTIDARVQARSDALEEAMRVQIERIAREAELAATQRAAEAIAIAVQSNGQNPAGPKPAVYAFDTPFIYSQQHSSRMRPKSRIDLDTLRRVAGTYDVMRSCINHLKTEVAAVPMAIVAKDPKDDSEQTKRAIQDATGWFDTRAGGLGGFGTHRRHFEDQIFEDALVIGAFAVYVQPTRIGKPYEAVAIDSMTIKPKVDPYGWQNPSDAYEQWVQGMVVRPSITMEELIYDGLHPVSWSPYFISPVEWLIGVTMSALKADEWNRTWLTDGNTPDQLIAVPKEWTPEQLIAYSQYFDAMLSGQMADRRKARIVPDGTKPVMVQTRKDSDFQEFELWLMRRTCSIFQVQPASIGYTGEQYKVSQDLSMKQTTQFGAGRLLAMRKDLYDELLARHGFEHLECKNVTEGEESPADRSTRLQASVGGPWMTPNEARQVEGLDPIEGGDELVGSQQPGEDEFDDSDPEGSEGDGAKRAEDLKRWERKSLSRLKDGKGAACPFESPWVDELERAEILAELEGCSTADEVKDLFRAFNPHQPRDARGRFMATYKVAKLSASLHNAHGGSTVNYLHGNMAGKPYFSVSTHLDRTAKLEGLKAVTPQQVRQFARRNLDLLRTGKFSVGTWYNPENHTTYLDVVSTVKSRDRAMHLAAAHNQIAIFDLFNLEEINTGGTGN